MFDKKISLFSLLVIIYIAIVPIENTLLIVPGITISRILGIGIIIYGLGQLVFKNEKISNSKIIFPIMILFFIIIMSVLWSAITEETFRYLLLYSNLLIFTVILLLFKYTKFEFFLIKLFLAITGVFVSINIVFRSALTISYGDRITFSIGGGEIDLNNLAVSLVISVIIIFSLIEKKTFIIKLLGISSILFIIYAIFLTGSRGGLVSLIPAIITLFLLNSRKRPLKILKQTIFIIFIGFISMYLVINYLPENLYERFFSLSNFQMGQLSRTKIWLSALNSYSDFSFLSMLFGKGVGSFPYILYSYYGSYIGAHNDYINVLIEFGIVGTLIMIIIIAKTLINTIKRQDILFTVLVIVLIIGSMTVDLFQRKIYWVVIFLCNAEVIYTRRKN